MRKSLDCFFEGQGAMLSDNFIDIRTLFTKVQEKRKYLQ